MKRVYPSAPEMKFNGSILTVLLKIINASKEQAKKASKGHKNASKYTSAPWEPKIG